jgi:hypothetical protein
VYPWVNGFAPGCGEELMSRTGYLVVGALVFALAAAGVLVWTNVLELQTPSTAPTTSPSAGPANNEIDWIKGMAELATSEGVVFSFADNDVAAWSITDGHRIERFKLSGASQTFARLSSGHPLDPQDRLSGLQLKLPLAWAQKVNGKRIEVGVVARQPHANASADISILYATLQAGNSGWHTLKLPAGFEALKFSYDVPAIETGYQTQPIVVVRADAQGGDRAVELVGIYLKPISN